jgi:RimJ/RimL family protein N-acetyltransferase
MSVVVGRIYEPELPELVVRELWEHLRDDSDIRPEEYEARIDDDSRWYVAIIGDDVFGVYWAHRINHITWQIHANVRKRYWGSEDTVPTSIEILDYVFKDTGASKLISIIPKSSPHVLRHAKVVGFKQEGCRVKSFQKDGELYDEIYLALTK